MFQPQMTFTMKINENLAKIDKIRDLIRLVPIVPQWEIELQRSALVSTVHYSTMIEGNTISLENVGKLLSGRKAPGPNKDKQEVANLQQVMGFINEVISDTRIDVNERLIKQFNKIILRDIPGIPLIGDYRAGPNLVQDNITGEVLYTPPTEWAVPELMRDFIEWAGMATPRLHPVLVAGIAHLELVAIHPFWDGNGRVARALSSFIMARNGYNLKRLFSWEEYVGKNVDSYTRAIRASSSEKYAKNYDSTPWLEYFTDAIAGSLESLQGQLEKMKQHLDEGYSLGTSLGLKPMQIQALTFIRLVGEISTSTYIKGTGVSRATAVRQLQKLLDTGLLQRIGKGRNARYVFSDNALKELSERSHEAS